MVIASYNVFEELTDRVGGIILDGTPIDLTKITVPVCIISTKNDHIAPWKSTYAATQIYKGPVRLVPSASGHMAGVINPPAAGKYCFWTAAKTRQIRCLVLRRETDRRVLVARLVEMGETHAGSQIKARKPGDAKFNPLEDAPGSYVKVRFNP